MPKPISLPNFSHIRASAQQFTTPKARLNYLANFLDLIVPAENFDMANWRVDRPSCGTVCCMGGWTAALWGEPDNAYSQFVAEKILGLTDGESADLFFPSPTRRLPDSSPAISCTDPHHAAKVLRHFIATREVNWAVA